MAIMIKTPQEIEKMRISRSRGGGSSPVSDGKFRAVTAVVTASERSNESSIEAVSRASFE